MASAAVATPPPPSQPARRGNAQPAAEDAGKGIWSSMLDSVGSGKKLAEKNLLILGGTTETQKEFVDALATEDGAPGRRPYDRLHSKRPPIANRFALGYTYQDVLDADQDDILARLSLYLLADRHPSFSSLLEPLFTPASIPDTLVVILLDWDSPWAWARQLRDWVRILRAALRRLDGPAHDAMDTYMAEWRERRRGADDVEGVAPPTADGEPAAPPGPGAWDEPLGLPLCVVCQRAEQTDALEREHGWKDDEFDYVLQWLRTVLLKHGAGLVYTASSAPGPLPALARSSLGIRSLLQRRPLRHNTIDRDRILVPPNWDSQGKIKQVGDAFDIAGVSAAWSLDIQGEPGAADADADVPANVDNTDTDAEATLSSAVAAYERRIADPAAHRAASASALRLGADPSTRIDTPCEDLQSFLAKQNEALEALRAEDEREARSRDAKKPGAATSASSAAAPSGASAAHGKVNEHIGPVQFNMGGIQVDADDMLKGLRERGDARDGGATPAAASGPSTANAATDTIVGSPGARVEHEKLSSFFAGLMSKSGGGGGASGAGSAAASPRAPRSERGDESGGNGAS